MDSRFRGRVDIATLLLVDDEESICCALRILFERHGYRVLVAKDYEQAIALLDREPCAPVITDISLPGRSGFDLLETVNDRDPELPVIVLTAYGNLEVARRAIRHGAYDFIVKPYEVDEILLSVQRGLEKWQLTQTNRAYQKELERRVEERTRELNQALRDLDGVLDESRKAHLETIIVLSKVLEIGDTDTGNHIRRISRFSVEIARALALDERFLEQIEYSAPMHDIGKIFMPSEILKKPGPLTKGEYAIVQEHPMRGAEILEGIQFLEMAWEIALCHHERYDGSGYPRRLRAEEIPLSARIVALADCFDALVSRRCYKDAYPIERVFQLIRQYRGNHFDPQVVDAFFEVQTRIRAIVDELRDDAKPSISRRLPSQP